MKSKYADGPRRKQIAAALSDARTALNSASYEALSDVDLYLATERVSRALNRVRREVKRNMRHEIRDTRKGPQCSCGAPFWPCGEAS